MALNSGKILMRRGQEANFDPNKMIPGEWAVSLDSKFVRMCFSPGVCIRMATYEAFEADMEQIRGILAECQTVEEAVQRIYEDIKDVAVDVERIEAAAASALESEENALNSANLAVQSANTATQKASEAAGSANIASAKAEQATEGASTATQKASEAVESADNVRNMSEVSQSYAIGGTGTREGEDTDNAKYYNQQASGNADRAEEAAERASVVAGFGGTYTELRNKPTINDVELVGNKTIDELGGLTEESTVSFTEAEERTNIEATDNVKGIFGKIKKWFADLKPHAFSNPTNNLLATVAGTPLDAVQGKVLRDETIKINPTRFSGNNVETVEGLLELFATDISNIYSASLIKDMGGWGPTEYVTEWYAVDCFAQNQYIENQTYETNIRGIMYTGNGIPYNFRIAGRKGGETVKAIRKIVLEEDTHTSMLKIIGSGDFETIANSVEINKKLHCRLHGKSITGMPSEDMYTCEITAISDVTVLAIAYNISSGDMYSNTKAAGTWQGWKRKTTTIS